jgi:DNA mismatch repair protein MSH5
VDEELDHMRLNYHGLDSFLSEIAKEISVTIPSDFTSIINVIYFPQLGYLITVPRNPEWKSEEDCQLEGLTVQVQYIDLTMLIFPMALVLFTTCPAITSRHIFP